MPIRGMMANILVVDPSAPPPDVVRCRQFSG
jgi:hypothetical protein